MCPHRACIVRHYSRCLLLGEVLVRPFSGGVGLLLHGNLQGHTQTERQGLGQSNCTLLQGNWHFLLLTINKCCYGIANVKIFTVLSYNLLIPLINNVVFTDLWLLCVDFQIVERIASAAATACTGQNEQQIGIECMLLLDMTTLYHVMNCVQCWIVLVCWRDSSPFCLKLLIGGCYSGRLQTFWKLVVWQ